VPTVTRSLTVRSRQTQWRVPRLTVLAGGVLALTVLFVVVPAAAATPVVTDGAASSTATAGPYPVGDAATGYLALRRSVVFR
jgi:hypothetical protein